MRLADIGDYFALRRHLVRPWAFLRLRKHPPGGAHTDVPLRDGGAFRLRAVPMDRHVFHRVFARDEYGLNGIAPRSLETVIDVGAHIGAFTVRVAPLARRVLAYEPVGVNYETLAHNAGRFPHVRTFRAAVSGRRGSATLFLDDAPDRHSMFPSEAARRTNPVTIETVTLEDVFRENGVEACDLLKMDCEGAEYETIYAAPPDLWRRVKAIRMEYHRVADRQETWTAEHLVRHLEGAGHRCTLRPSDRKEGQGILFSTLR